MHHRWPTLTLLALGLMMNAAHLPASQLIEVIGLEYPPFSSLTMKDGGINNRLLRAYFSGRSDVDIVNVYYPPARAQSIIANEQWCASFYPPSQGRVGDVKFIKLRDEPVDMGIFRLKHKDEFRWESLSEFKGSSMAILRFVLEGPYFKRFTDAGINIVEVGSLQQSYKLVLSGRVDYAVGDMDSMHYALDNIITEKELQFSDTLLRSVDVGVFVHPNCHEVFFETTKH
ncbi:MAG: hypothetical protein ACRBBW_20270 [Cellvibrionaceae bacterium]